MPGMGGTEGPGGASTLDELVDRLVRLRALAGTPSYSAIARRVGEIRADRGVAGPGPGRVTIYDCFRTGRRRLDPDLFGDVVAALAADPVVVPEWTAALARVTGRRRPHRPVVRTRVPRRGEELRGRDHERAALRALPPGSCALITGMPGIGKTELAVALAADRASAGARPLIVDLHGFDAAVGPAEPGAVVEQLLRALGVPGDQMAKLDDSARVALLRRLADVEPLVLVLDNASEAGQVTELLLTRTRSWTLVTSRRELDLPGPVQRMSLEPVSPAVGLEIVGDLLGADRVAAEPAAALALVEECGGLPLQLTVVGGLAAGSPWSLADMGHRLRELKAAGATVPALEGSFTQLPADARRALTLLALHPPGPVDVASLAALLDVPLETADVLADRLAHDHLVRRIPASRLVIHDLVRAFARQHLVADVPRSVQLSASWRLADRLVAAAEEAAADPVDDHWLSRHRAAIWEVLRGCGPSAPYERAAEALAEHLDRHVLVAEAVTLYTAALEHAPPDRAWRLHQLLGQIYLRAARPAEAERELSTCLADPSCAAPHAVGRALGRALRLSARTSEARAVLGTVLRDAPEVNDLAAGRAAFELALLESAAGRHGLADDLLTRARELFVRTDARDDLALCASAGGWLALARGDADAARRHAEDAAAHVETVTDRQMAARLLHFRASWLRHNGRSEEARRLLAAPQAVEAAEQHSTVGQSIRLLRARLVADAGQLDESIDQLREIQLDSHRLHLTEDRLEALNDLGELLLRRGDSTEARETFEYAYALALQSEDVGAAATARAGIARTEQSG